MDDNKKVTVKSIDKEIEREKRKLARDTEKQKAISAEISETAKRIRELEKLRVTVSQNEFHNKIYRQYIKKGVVTEDDILVWLNEKKAQDTPQIPQSLQTQQIEEKPKEVKGDNHA